MKILFLGTILSVLYGIEANQQLFKSSWGYECENSQCRRFKLDNSRPEAVSLPVCRIFCGQDTGTLWPKPSGNVTLKNVVAKLNPATVSVRAEIFESQTSFWEENENRFLEQIRVKLPKNIQIPNEGKNLIVMVVPKEKSLDLTIDTDETYVLETKEDDEYNIVATIMAETAFGARHGLETLSQLIVYDDIRMELQIVGEFRIEDGPAYKHRGLVLDTARNYFSVDSIKRTIDAMAMVKLNTFHWHITDSQSFPLVLESQPELARLGAYSPDKIYTANDVADILDWANVRGVRVIPEFDAPAHVGEGWQSKGLTACFNHQPWGKYCVEPPCGQLDPSKGELYDILENIYHEMLEMFRYPDVFHMGGDEVSVTCWNTSAEIQNWMIQRGWGLEEIDFMKLWGYFQENALNRLDRVNKKKVPIFMWTSRLTEEPFAKMYLDNKRYIVQIWTTGDDPKVQHLLENGYRLVLSNYDALYFDCGFGSWVGEGTNWCSPYIGWDKVYKNDPAIIGGQYKDQILGAEAALWSEQADDVVLDGRFWPRASALAERLWSNPKTSWRDAEPRMLIHRERLVQNGIAAESLQPQWCLQHEGECPAS